MSFLFVSYIIREEETANICRDCGAEKVTGSRDLARRIHISRTEAVTVGDVILVNAEAEEGAHSYSARHGSVPYTASAPGILAALMVAKRPPVTLWLGILSFGCYTHGH